MQQIIYRILLCIEIFLDFFIQYILKCSQYTVYSFYASDFCLSFNLKLCTTILWTSITGKCFNENLLHLKYFIKCYHETVALSGSIYAEHGKRDRRSYSYIGMQCHLYPWNTLGKCTEPYDGRIFNFLSKIVVFAFYIINLLATNVVHGLHLHHMLCWSLFKD